MSELRNHLDRLAAAHRAAGYRGNLAEETLGRRDRGLRLWPLYPAAASIAVSLLLAIFIHHRVIPTILAPAPSPSEKVSVSVAPTVLPQMEVPSGSDVVPSGIDLTPSDFTFTIPSASLGPSLDSSTDSGTNDSESHS